MTKERRFYCPPDAEKLLDELADILKREGKSLSAWIRDQARQYVELHMAGNPQQRLDTIMRLGHAYRAKSCCVCTKPGEYQVFMKRGVTLLYCGECFEKTGRSLSSGYQAIRKKMRKDF